MTNITEESRHFGIIRSITNGEIEVGVDPPVACSSCEVSSSCGLSDKEEKIINIHTSTSEYNIGEKVEVTYEEKLSSRALVLVYILPLVVIITTIYITQLLTNSELIIGLVALLSLIPYFLLFKLFSKSISTIFSFSILKLNEEFKS